MSVELKPCPWCRSAAAIHWRAGTAFASCEDLGCVGSDLAAYPTAWNTRAPEPNQARIEALEAEVERLRGALSGLANALELPHQRGVLTMVPGALIQARAALEASHAP